MLEPKDNRVSLQKVCMGVKWGRERTNWDPRGRAETHEKELEPCSVLSASNVDDVGVLKRKLVLFLTELNTPVGKAEGGARERQSSCRSSFYFMQMKRAHR